MAGLFPQDPRLALGRALFTNEPASVQPLGPPVGLNLEGIKQLQALNDNNPRPTDKYKTGSILPLQTNLRTGEKSLAMPEFAKSLWDAFTLPGDTLSGKTDPNSEEGIARALGFAGNIGLPGLGGSMAKSAASGAIPDPNTLGVFYGSQGARNLGTYDKFQKAAPEYLNILSELDQGTMPPGDYFKRMEDTFGKTGVFLGADMTLQRELPDFPGYLNHRTEYFPDLTKNHLIRMGALDPMKTVERQRGQMGDFLDRPELYDAYPDLKNVWTELVARAGAPSGYYNSGKNLINAEAFSSDDVQSTLLHEINHWIQGQEGFAKGGNPTGMGKVLSRLAGTDPNLAASLPEAHDSYEALIGETSSRNVQKRFEEGIGPEVNPRFTEDIPRAFQLNPDMVIQAQQDYYGIPGGPREEVLRTLQALAKYKDAAQRRQNAANAGWSNP